MSKDKYYENEILKILYDPDFWVGDSLQDNEIEYNDFIEMYNRINALNPSLVIDAGCGRNPHKNKIQNLIGFDPAEFPEADFHSTILNANFKSESADAVLALGSIQFIDEYYVKENIEKILGWCKKGGIIEMRIAYSDRNKNSKYRKYPWRDGLIDEFTKNYNLSFIVKPKIMKREKTEDRLRWTWIKN